MEEMMKCPECGNSMIAGRKVSCMCDLDFCEGQRCGADKLVEFYECPKCHKRIIPKETIDYMKAHKN